ncbi:BolA protein [Kalmanozyma brasiliensis GHG001]|uniref:Bola-like protein n=1 Tax=Kalmanozyma brasiliensis (strain GHG001) TaxID=1365824 RepID=V5EX33_KALBG|nr:BolA protein [Kalmanozyma brasiliensis GHG001]EST06939.1 BolA protein [Kalmanozyma brasiliensis GHG001]
MFGSITTAARSTLARRSALSAPLRSLTTTRMVANTTAAPSQEEQVTAGEQKIREILTAKFNPAVLKVQDVSGGCGSFYAIQLSSKEFKGMSTVKAHRLVNSELKDVIKDIHGLQLRTVAED